MSVRKYERKASKIAILQSSIYLAEEIIRLVNKEDLFPKRSRWIMANRLVNDSLDCLDYISSANDQPLGSSERIKFQCLAKAKLKNINRLLDLSNTSLNVPLDKTNYASEIVVQMLDQMQKWMQSDKDRIKQKR